MLACIACVNKEEGGGRDRDREDGGARSGGGDTPSCRDPVKSLTSQVHSSIISPPLLFLFFINSLAGCRRPVLLRPPAAPAASVGT